MHEAALAVELVGLIASVAHEHQAVSVVSANLQLGELSCVDAEGLRFAFGIYRKGTIASGCKLRIDVAPLVVFCGCCGSEQPGRRDPRGCGTCKQSPVQVSGGREMQLVSIDVEEVSDA